MFTEGLQTVKARHGQARGPAPTKVLTGNMERLWRVWFSFYELGLFDERELRLRPCPGLCIDGRGKLNPPLQSGRHPAALSPPPLEHLRKETHTQRWSLARQTPLQDHSWIGKC